MRSQLNTWRMRLGRWDRSPFSPTAHPRSLFVAMAVLMGAASGCHKGELGDIGAECDNDDDCRDPYTCIESKCGLQCDSNEDCEGDDVCVENLCAHPEWDVDAVDGTDRGGLGGDAETEETDGADASGSDRGTADSGRTGTNERNSADTGTEGTASIDGGGGAAGATGSGGTGGTSAVGGSGGESGAAGTGGWSESGGSGAAAGTSAAGGGGPLAGSGATGGTGGTGGIAGSGGLGGIGASGGTGGTTGGASGSGETGGLGGSGGTGGTGGTSGSGGSGGAGGTGGTAGTGGASGSGGAGPGPVCAPITGLVTDNAKTLAISENYLYVADGPGGLKVVDISNPLSPSIIGSVLSVGDIDYVALDPTVSRPSIIVAHDPAVGLVTIDISEPSAPQVLGSEGADADYRAIVLSGEYAFVAHHDICTVSIADLLSPIQVGSCAGSGNIYFPNAMFLSDDLLYVVDTFVHLHIINVSNPQVPTLMSSLDLDDTPMDDVAVKDSHAFTVRSQYGYGLYIHDISNPLTPTMIRQLPDVYASDFFMLGDVLLASGGVLYVIDISNPPSPVVFGSCSLSGETHDIVAISDYAFLAAGDKGIKVVSLSIP